jgi:t-SNARE complex subunit (syntaxin)
MKKIALIISVTIYGSFFITSCEQPKADPAVMENKIKEAYEAKKVEIDTEVSNACETKINEKVKMFQDSIATLSASQQAAAKIKMQKELDLAQKKAKDAAKKKELEEAAKKKIKEAEAAKVQGKKDKMNGGETKVTKEQTQSKKDKMSGEETVIKVTEEQTNQKKNKMRGGE